jgi:hypothetical protein
VPVDLGEQHPFGSPNGKRPLRQLVEEGRLLSLDYEPVTGDALKLLKARLLWEYDHIPFPGDVPQLQDDWLIRDLWLDGTIPVLAGQYKVGKSTLVVTELVPSLLVPGHRFLNHFEPIDAKHSNEILWRGVWLINVEVRIADMEKAVWPVDQAEQRDLLTVDHLRSLGGPEILDITDPTNYELWWHRLSTCLTCDGSDFTTPYVVIVDGLTTILESAGKGLEDSSAWLAAFMRLMRSLDIPNALVVAHATMKGDHGMGGTEFLALAEGLWKYTANDPDDPLSKRWFSVVPRFGGEAIPKSQVTLDDASGRGLPAARLGAGSGRSPPAPGPSSASPANPAGGSHPTTRTTGQTRPSAVSGWLRPSASPDCGGSERPESRPRRPNSQERGRHE